MIIKIIPKHFNETQRPQFHTEVDHSKPLGSVSLKELCGNIQ